MLRKAKSARLDIRLARRAWGELPASALRSLEELVLRHGLSVLAGDVLYLDKKWYVTHAGLLGLAQRKGCAGIRVQAVRELCDPAAGRWVFKATVYKSPGARGFAGYGDAEPSNVSSLVRGAEMRVAETRAVNRALRKAYGIGLCSVEEIGALPRRIEPVSASANAASAAAPSVSGNGRPRLRDRLCQLIRQHKLDPALVKLYAAEFCGTENLREASREQVQAFIQTLAERATKDRAGLICQLNSYARPQEKQA